jgi:hypothetical protein
LKKIEGKCVEVQMLKFGKIVDLEKLEKMGVNKAAEDLRQQLSLKDRQHTVELEMLDVSFCVCFLLKIPLALCHDERGLTRNVYL